MYKKSKIAGITFGDRQKYSAAIHSCERRGEKVYLSLRREKKNKYDASAICVIAHCPSRNLHFTLGYVPHDEAIQLAPLMDNGKKPFVLKHDFGYAKKTFSCKFTYSI